MGLEEDSPYARVGSGISADAPSRVGSGTSADGSADGGGKWGVAKRGVMGGVGLSTKLHTLRDMGSTEFIDPDTLETVKTLGEGAFATVEQAWYTPPGGGTRFLVAVKRLKRELFENPSELTLFRKEVSLMRKLRHRNIVDFIGAGELDQGSTSAFVVQEYMCGGTLKQLVTRQMLANGARVYTNEQALDICLQMARGLRYLHSTSPMVIHRDLKLENVLLRSANPAKGQGYEVKLADFGLSRCVESKRRVLCFRRKASNAPLREHQSANLEEEWRRRASAKLRPASFTATSTSERHDMAPPAGGLRRMMSIKSMRVHGAPSPADVREPANTTFALTGRTGSLMYMAPEVFLEAPYNEKADVFSFGIMMSEVMQKYIMLSAVAVKGTYEELIEYAARVAAGFRPPLHDSWPTSIRGIIEDCWAQDPAERPSMEQVVTRLEAAAASGDLAALDAKACGCTIC
ncbi:splA [Scenedesmus sp. PABB004]|nr:splA [Scenedesmus sp. PABB004]